MATLTGKTPFDRACVLLDSALTGTFRHERVAEASRASDLGKALLRLRERMRAHDWSAGARTVKLDRLIAGFDARTRQDGFHAMHDWDGIADAVNKDTIPVDVLHYLVEQRGSEPVQRNVLAILLDYYFLHILALLSLRAWDSESESGTGTADERLDRLDRLLGHLQGPGGSGQRFVTNAGTLVLIATSHYELNERGFAPLLDKVRALGALHRLDVSLSHAAAMGSHLRFGFEATYARDTVVMRNDNVVDYPWLSCALSTLMDEYVRLRTDGVTGAARDAIVEAMLNGLSPDSRAFVGNHPPASLSSCEHERAGFRERFHHYRQDLLEELEAHRPSDGAYSPLSFFFNFSHNVLKGTVIDALLTGDPWPLAFNDLLTAIPRAGHEPQRKEELARTLMGYARSSPDRIRGRLMPVIVYDPAAGRQAFSVTLRKLREA